MRKPDEPGSDGTFVMEHRRFINTALTVFSGAECWFQHFHIVQAIVKRLRRCTLKRGGIKCGSASDEGEA